MRNRNFDKTFNMIFYGVLLFMGFCFIMIILRSANAITSQNVSFGVNGVVETRCINGYQFIVAERETRQVMDELGHGVKCLNQ